MNASLDSRHLLDAPLASARALPFRTRIRHLEIVRAIAETDLGIEYLAIDRARHTEVVLKEYLPSRLARREGSAMRPHTPAEAAKLALGLQAFIAEPRLLPRTEHPALAHVIGIIEANDTAYHVMSHGSGVPLLRMRQEMNGAPDERTLRRLLDDVLGALETLHHDGLLHGAVAPSNILLLADDRALLLGPEAARAKTDGDLIDSLMASVEPSFAAPEQRDPSSALVLDASTDLYSLAETMRFCISGELPPRAGEASPTGPREPMAQMVRRLFADTLTPPYGASLLGTLDAALDANPLMRPQSAAEFRDALGKAPAAATPLRPVGAPPIKPTVAPVAAPAARAARAAAVPSAPHMSFRPPRQQHRAVWAGAALALLLVAGTYGWWRFDQTARVALPTPVVTPSTEIAAVAPPLASAPTPIPIIESLPSPAPAPPAPPPAPPAPAAQTQALPVNPPSLAGPASPRESCGERTQFALYRCMQSLCEQRGWTKHPQCDRLRATDSVE